MSGILTFTEEYLTIMNVTKRKKKPLILQSIRSISLSLYFALYSVPPYTTILQIVISTVKQEH